MKRIIDMDSMLLDKKQMEKIKALSDTYDDIELEMVSGSDVVMCPGCTSNGCFGSCTMDCCFTRAD